jgi:hypothetical protein
MAALLINGKSTDVYSTLNYSLPNFIRNTNFWGASVDLTCAAVTNSSDSYGRRGATLITRKHFICAEHYQIPVGQTIKWVTADNTIISRTVTALTRISNDLEIGTLDSEVPSSIGFAKMLPSNWRGKVGDPYGSTTINGVTVYWTSHFPTFFFNQYAEACVADLNETTNFTILSFHETSVTEHSEFFPTWEGPIISGDSGQPCFLLINGDPVLLTTWFGAGGGVDFSQYLTQINAYITPYSVTQADLSAFNTY